MDVEKPAKIRPAVADYYNQHMGAVDQADAAIHRYWPANRTRKWTIVAFIFLVKLCINNAWVLLKNLSSASSLASAV